MFSKLQLFSYVLLAAAATAYAAPKLAARCEDIPVDQTLVQNVGSGLFLDLFEAEIAPGTPVIGQTRNVPDTDNQQWVFAGVSRPTGIVYVVANAQGGEVVGIGPTTGNSITDGDSVLISNDNIRFLNVTEPTTGAYQITVFPTPGSPAPGGSFSLQSPTVAIGDVTYSTTITDLTDPELAFQLWRFVIPETS